MHLFYKAFGGIKKDPAYPKVYKVVFLIILLFFLFSLTLKKFVLFWRVEIKKGYTRTVINYFPLSRIAACAAARRAIGTRKGEQDT